jgi:hypothetical protein
MRIQSLLPLFSVSFFSSLSLTQRILFQLPFPVAVQALNCPVEIRVVVLTPSCERNQSLTGPPTRPSPNIVVCTVFRTHGNIPTQHSAARNSNAFHAGQIILKQSQRNPFGCTSQHRTQNVREVASRKRQKEDVSVCCPPRRPPALLQQRSVEELMDPSAISQFPRLSPVLAPIDCSGRGAADPRLQDAKPWLLRPFLFTVKLPRDLSIVS